MIIPSFISPSAVGSANVGSRQEAAAQTTKTSDAARPAAIIDLSAEAMMAGETDDFVTTRLGDATRNLFDGVTPYRQDLAVLVDRGVAHTEDGEDVGQLLAAREWAAYGHHASYSDKFKAAIEYYDSLSPAEQNSSRYRGMRANAMQMYQAAIEMENGQAENLEGNQNLAVDLFELLELPEPSVEKLRGVETAYERMLDRLDGFAGDGFLREAAIAAGERFEVLMRTIEASAAGDESAFAALNALADGTIDGTGFAEARKAA